MRGEESCPFCGSATDRGSRVGGGLLAAVAMGLALGGCADDGEDSTTQMTTMSDGVESDSAGEATYGVPMTESGDDTDPFGASSSTTGGPETDTDDGGNSSAGDPDTDTDTDAGASSSSGGAGSSSSTSG